MQTARYFVGIAVEFTARMQLGHDDFGGGNALTIVHANRNTAPVVGDGNRAVFMDRNGNMIGMTRQRFVNPVVHNFIHHMVKAGPIVGIPDIHTGTLTNGF